MRLADEPTDTVLRIATELKLPHNFVVMAIGSVAESTFWEPGYFRLFLSHLTIFRKETARLQRSLRPFGVSAFVAHVDIEPTREWMREIELGLLSMDAMAAIVMPGFKPSSWTDQEVGVAMGRNVLVVPVLRGCDPHGFLSKYQGLRAEGLTVGQVAHGVADILGRHDRTSARLISVLTSLVAASNTEEEAIHKLVFLGSINISSASATQLREVVSQNDVLRASAGVRDQLNAILRKRSIPELGEVGLSAGDFDDWTDFPF